METDNYALAGTSAGDKPEQPVGEAREIFPVKFDKDYMDFRVQTGEEIDEVPKGWSARASVTTSGSPTGLEDVSREDLENPASLSVVRDSQETSSVQSDSGKQTSSGVI